MTEKNGRDSDLDPDRHSPSVVPIRGYKLPPPPGWEDPRPTTAKTLGNLTPTVLAPEDYTIRGALRCTYTAQGSGERCGNALVLGTTGCEFHNRKHANPAGYANPDLITSHDDNRNAKKAKGETRADRADRIREHLEGVAGAAVTAIAMVLEDDMSRPQDRLKAAEIVLDRTIGRTLMIEADNKAERELDVEILELADDFLPKTGTEDA